MRAAAILILSLALLAFLTIFPDVAGQPLRIEAFGWLFETRQGAFAVALLLLLGLFWLLRLLITALFAGPGQIWSSIRSSSKKSREARLKEALAQMIDMRPAASDKSLKKSRGIIPDWGMKLLSSINHPPTSFSPDDFGDDNLRLALAARLATDPGATKQPDLVTRKSFLQAWLAAHPGAPLAVSRMADIAEEERDWKTLVGLLESTWGKGESSASSIKPRLAKAYVGLAANNPSEADTYLKKAFRLLPDSSEVVTALGEHHLRKKDEHSALKLWIAYVYTHNDFIMAERLLTLMKKEAMGFYRRMESEHGKDANAALRWLLAMLAHEAGLSGLATEHMEKLLDSSPNRQAWQALGDWHMQAGKHDEAARCYQQALSSTD